MSADNGTQYLSLDAAVCMLQGGCRFGDVQEQVALADRDALKRAFVLDPACGPEPKGGRKPIPKCPPKPNAEASDQLCPRCGGFMVRTGTCLTCQSCGESSGGCG